MKMNFKVDDFVSNTLLFTDKGARIVQLYNTGLQGR
jgi:hypothetical protein